MNHVQLRSRAAVRIASMRAVDVTKSMSREGEYHESVATFAPCPTQAVSKLPLPGATQLDIDYAHGLFKLTKHYGRDSLVLALAIALNQNKNLQQVIAGQRKALSIHADAQKPAAESKLDRMLARTVRLECDEAADLLAEIRRKHATAV